MLSQPQTFQVIQDDIEQGVEEDCEHCALALAARRAFGTPVSVSGTRFHDHPFGIGSNKVGPWDVGIRLLDGEDEAKGHYRYHLARIVGESFEESMKDYSVVSVPVSRLGQWVNTFDKGESVDPITVEVLPFGKNIPVVH